MVRSSQSEKEYKKQSFSLICLICGMAMYFIIHRHSPHRLEIPWGQDKSGDCLLECQLQAHSQNEATGNSWGMQQKEKCQVPRFLVVLWYHFPTDTTTCEDGKA